MRLLFKSTRFLLLGCMLLSLFFVQGLSFAEASCCCPQAVSFESTEGTFGAKADGKTFVEQLALKKVHTCPCGFQSKSFSLKEKKLSSNSEFLHSFVHSFSAYSLSSFFFDELLSKRKLNNFISDKRELYLTQQHLLL